MIEAPENSGREAELEAALLRARDWLRHLGIAACDLSFVDTALGYTAVDVARPDSFDSSLGL